MNIVHLDKDHCYKTSQDYARLWELAQKTSVLCIVDYNDCRDIAATLWFGATEYASPFVQVGVRGMCYISADTKDKFVEHCERDNLEFIVPEEA